MKMNVLGDRNLSPSLFFRGLLNIRKMNLTIICIHEEHDKSSVTFSYLSAFPYLLNIICLFSHKNRLHCGTNLGFTERETNDFPLTKVVLLLLSIHTLKRTLVDTLTHFNTLAIQIHSPPSTGAHCSSQTHTHSVSSY